MTLLEHLEELRRRIIVISVAIVIAAIAGFVLGDPIIRLLRTPLPEEGAGLIQTRVAEALNVRLTIALMVGVALAMPVILYEVWAFVTPGLTRSERRVVWPLLGLALVLFTLGLTVGYLVLPVAVRFLIDLSPADIPALLSLGEYVGFVTTLLLAFGLAFQFPIVLLVLSRAGILRYSFLAARRRWAVLLIVLFSILITPGDLLIGSAVLTVMMYGLFEGTLQVMKRLERRRSAGDR
jgi:sec-independent protein translocase protein TatC